MRANAKPRIFGCSGSSASDSLYHASCRKKSRCASARRNSLSDVRSSTSKNGSLATLARGAHDLARGDRAERERRGEPRGLARARDVARDAVLQRRPGEERGELRARRVLTDGFRARRLRAELFRHRQRFAGDLDRRERSPLPRVRRRDQRLPARVVRNEGAVAVAAGVARRRVLRRHRGRVVHRQRAQPGFFERRLQVAVAPNALRVVAAAPADDAGADGARQRTQRLAGVAAAHDQRGCRARAAPRRARSPPRSSTPPGAASAAGGPPRPGRSRAPARPRRGAPRPPARHDRSGAGPW